MPGRGNGLSAAAYVPLIDLAPQLADAMLEALRDEGIAAYATPAPGEVGSYLDTRLPDEPTDRLYVDAAAKEPAQRVLNARLPQLHTEYERSARSAAREPYEDEAWRQIVASFDQKLADPIPPWPVSEDIADSEADEPPSQARVVRPAADPSEDEPAAELEDDDHFVPPPPPPLPRTDPLTKWAWLALFGGPAYLLLAAIFGWQPPGWAAFLAVAAFVGGFVTLVLRMGDDPPRDSGPDDGAVV